MADITRAEALALINQGNTNEIFQQALEFSAALRTFRTVPMGTKQVRMPVLEALPTAGFVTETGTKTTSQVTWESKTLEAEEIAVIVPIHENVLEDSTFDIWGEVRGAVAQELGRVLDGAVFFGTNAPASFDASLAEGARAAGNFYDQDTAGDLAEDINQTIALVEADGFDPNTIYTNRVLRASLRGLRDDNNQPIYSTSLKNDGSTPAVYGLDLEFVTNNAWVSGASEGGATAIVGDASKAIIGIRSDVEYKILTEATVGDINLAERDMVALRAKFRVGFVVADPTTIEGGSSAYPFALLGPNAT